MKEFFKMFFASLTAMAIAVIGGGLVFFVFLGVLISSAQNMSQPPASVEDNSILYFNMSARVQDSPVSQTQEQLINEALGAKGPENFSLYNLVNAIEAAADDDRIKGIYLKGSFSTAAYASSFASLKEVRGALEKFQESGKPVIAYLVYPTSRDLYVASVADEVYMNPDGIFASSGMASQPIFFAGFFKKYGIGVQVTKAGEYKSAAEPFVLEKMSEPAREATEALIGDLWDEYLDALADKSERSTDEIQKVMDEEGLISADVAVEAGLVDELLYEGDVIAKLKALTGAAADEPSVDTTTMSNYARLKGGGYLGTGEHIAVVYAEGDIVNGEGGGGQVGGDGIARELRKLRFDESVKAVVLRVNSPGGSALASEVIQKEVREMRAAGKPVVVSMGGLAASGGYWISAYSDKIYAEETTITGSIGVIGMFLNIEEIASKHGFTFDTVKTSKFADAMTIARPKTEEEMGIIQAWVDQTYGDFLDKVSDGRSKDREFIAGIAEGRVWSGEDALELGLVDEIGGLNDAIAHAAMLADMDDVTRVKGYPKAKDFLQELLEDLSAREMGAKGAAALGAVQKGMEVLDSLSGYNDPRGIYAVMPYRLDVE
ncbi:MAG: signal peptide peptidase SppA [Verrucomicrobiota bacterium]